MEDLNLRAGQMIRSFKISRQTLGRWVEKGCPKVAKGVYFLPDVIEWRDKTFHTGGDAMSAAKLRREVAKARHQELVTAEKEKSLVPADTAVIWLCRGVSDARLGFMGFPRRLASTIFLLVQKALQESVSGIENPELRQGLEKIIPTLKFDEKSTEYELHKGIWEVLKRLSEPLKKGGKKG